MRLLAVIQLRCTFPTSTTASTARRGEVEMIESRAPAKASVEFADRVNADILCFAGRDRPRLPRFTLGSAAQEVRLLSRRAVLVVP